MIIDSHQHVMLPAELQIEKLNQAGVDKAILFPSAPHPERTTGLDELKEEMTALYRTLAGEKSTEASKQRFINNLAEQKDHIKKYPDRFLGFGAVPLGLSVEETKEWIFQYVIQNDFKGVGEFTPGSDEQIRQLQVVFEAASDYENFPLWIHTFHPVTMSGIKLLMQLCEQFPNVPVIFGHMGGANWLDVIDYARLHRQIYLDLSAAFASIATKTAIYELPERCLYSSDAPYGEPFLYRQLIEFVSPTREIANMVLGDNISKFL
ncbi:MAG: amidohydrolase family protein [Lachnospiraceae bacterium]|nr:amidohydrolase family protein [Lachnospiraceae bacterium]